MTGIILHKFGAKRIGHKQMPDFTKEENDSTKRRYIFSVDLDVKDSNNTSFRDRIDTIAKLNTLNTNKTHSQMQEKDLEVWNFCPDCIAKIKKGLGL